MRYISLIAIALFAAVCIFLLIHELPAIRKQEKDTDELQSLLGDPDDNSRQD